MRIRGVCEKCNAITTVNATPYKIEQAIMQGKLPVGTCDECQ